MKKVILLKDDTFENRVCMKAWVESLNFWGFPFDIVHPEELNLIETGRYSIVILSCVSHITTNITAFLDKHLQSENSGLIISGSIHAAIQKYLPGIKAKRVIRNRIHRCIRIKNRIGSAWKADDILFFTNTYNCSNIPGLDYEVHTAVNGNLDILALSQEMEFNDQYREYWMNWRPTDEPAVICNNEYDGRVLYISIPIGGMDWVRQPEIPDFTCYPYILENHGVKFFIKSILEFIAEKADIEFEAEALWPGNARCVVCLTGDVHEYENIAGRAGREYRDMVDNFNLLKEYGLEGRAAYYISGQTAEIHPESIADGLKRGYELCSHTYREFTYHDLKMSKDEQKQDILKCIKAFTKSAPDSFSYLKGFRTHAYNSDYMTREALEELNFEYLADMQMWSDLIFQEGIPPEMIAYVGCPQHAAGSRGRRLKLLEIPDTVPNDHFIYRVMQKNPGQALELWKKCFDVIYRTGSLFQTCWHPYISVKEDPARENTYREMIDYIQQHEGVLFLTMNELAEWWVGREGI